MIHIEWRENDVSDDSADSESDTTDGTDTNSDTSSKPEDMPPKEEPAKTIYKAARDEDWTDIERAEHLAPGCDNVEVRDAIHNHSAFETRREHDREEFRVKQ